MNTEKISDRKGRPCGRGGVPTPVSPGRPKGVPNKLSMSIKDAFEHAFREIGGGEALLEWGRNPKNQTAFFTLIAKLLPKDIKLDIGFTPDLSGLTPDRIKELSELYHSLKTKK
jgi:hypothetical protein